MPVEWPVSCISPVVGCGCTSAHGVSSFQASRHAGVLTRSAQLMTPPLICEGIRTAGMGRGAWREVEGQAGVQV